MERVKTLIMGLTTILVIVVFICQNTKSSIEIEKYELSRDISEVRSGIVGEILCDMSLSLEVQQEVESVKLVYDKEFTEYEKYLLAKIAMCEAEGQNIQTKTLVIMTVLNRVESKDFPDSIIEVIFQNNNGSTYEFSPVMPDGRWWSIEPNEDCYEAVEVVMSTEYDYSDGALYFESCGENSWHSKNLTYLYKSQDLRFYK